MAPNNKQKYIDYSITAINSLQRENGLTITDIVRHIKLTTDETHRFRPLFAKVRAATDQGISDGLLKRNRFRIQLRSDDDVMSSRDGSDASDGDSGSEEDEGDDGSSDGTTDDALSDDYERHERRKTAPARRVGKKQPQPRHLSTRACAEGERRGEAKRRLVDASSDEETDSDEDNSSNKRRKVQRKSRRNGTSEHRSAKRDLPLRSKSSPAAKPTHGGGGSKVSVGLVFPEIGEVKVEVEDSATRKRLPLVKTSVRAPDVGNDGNNAGKSRGSEEAREIGSGVGGEWSGSNRRIKEEVEEEKLFVPGVSGSRGERKGIWEVKEKEEEGNRIQDGDANGSTVNVKEEKGDDIPDGGENEASTLKVKVEKVDESKVKKEVTTIKSHAESGPDLYT